MKAKYEEVPGDIVFSQNFRHQNALTYHYLVQGTLENQQQLCNSWLNAPWQRRYHFSPLMPYVLVSFVNASCKEGRCARADWQERPCNNFACSRNILRNDRNEEMGHFKYNKVIVSMLLTGMDGNVSLFSPYSFCDDGTLIANNRELFGWNFLFAEIDFPALPIAENRGKFGFSCAIDIPLLSLTAPKIPETMLQLLPNKNIEGTESDLSFENINVAIQALPKYLQQQFTQRGHILENAALVQISNALLGLVPRLNLRQFRGTVSGNQAIVQGIQTCIDTDVTYQTGGTIAAGQTIKFPTTSAVAKLHFPLASDLGLPEEAEVIAGFWTLRNYVTQPLSLKWTGSAK